MAGELESKLPSPERVIDTFQAFHRTAAVKAGVELDLFTAIGEGADTVQALAPRRQAAERGIRILCDYLVVLGLLRKEGNRYTLSLDAATFLDRHSPAYFGSTVTYFACETNQEAFASSPLPCAGARRRCPKTARSPRNTRSGSSSPAQWRRLALS